MNLTGLLLTTPHERAKEMTDATRQYEIGGICCDMTAEQARRWNTGMTNDTDMRSIMVHDATANRYLTLAEAMDSAFAEQMDGMPANRI